MNEQTIAERVVGGPPQERLELAERRCAAGDKAVLGPGQGVEAGGPFRLRDPVRVRGRECNRGVQGGLGLRGTRLRLADAYAIMRASQDLYTRDTFTPDARFATACTPMFDEAGFCRDATRTTPKSAPKMNAGSSSSAAPPVG